MNDAYERVAHEVSRLCAMVAFFSFLAGFALGVVCAFVIINLQQ